MPTYEYKREDGTTFEITQKMSDAALTECPETGQKVRRIISGGSGVVYKGDGWYVTDYKDGGRNTASAKSKNNASDQGEAKPETTSKKTETANAPAGEDG